MHTLCNQSSKSPIHGIRYQSTHKFAFKVQKSVLISIESSFLLMKSTGCTYLEVNGHAQPLESNNLTIYSTFPTCNVTFGIGNGMESLKLGFLAKFHA